MREALEALEFVVVIDVAMTETAQLADYVLPAASQFEKAEATFFNFEFPHNYFHFRRPILEPLPGTLPEPEIHARIVEALGAFHGVDLTPLADAAEGEPRRVRRAVPCPHGRASRTRSADARRDLYRTLGPALPDGAASAALLWGACAAVRVAATGPASHGPASKEKGPTLGDALFDAILSSASGVTFSVDDHADSWDRVRTPDGRLNLSIDVLIDELSAARDRRSSGGRSGVPARALRRRAAIVHCQHDLSRSRMAKARRQRRALRVGSRRRSRCNSPMATPRSSRRGEATSQSSSRSAR